MTELRQIIREVASDLPPVMYTGGLKHNVERQVPISELKQNGVECRCALCKAKLWCRKVSFEAMQMVARDRGSSFYVLCWDCQQKALGEANRVNVVIGSGQCDTKAERN